MYSRVGKPCTTCHAAFGDQIRSASPQAIQGYLPRSAFRIDGVESSATKIPAIRPRIVYLTSSPTPSVMPSNTQYQCHPSMTRQRNQYRATIQVTWSKVTVWNTQLAPRK